MYCVVKNKKGLYIRLNENGKAVTCCESDKMLFEEHKAKNILAGLPKTLQKLGFKIEFVPEIGGVRNNIDNNNNVNDSDNNKGYIQNKNYSPPEEVTRWIEKIGVCDEIIQEARKRKSELLIALSDVDKQLSNLIHSIEFTNKIDMYGAWRERMYQNKLLEKRRHIKDELIILTDILKMDFRYLNKETVSKSVKGLSNRKFSLRIVEDEDNIVQEI